MKKHIYKRNPKNSEFWGADGIGALVMIANGLLNLVLIPFGRYSDMYVNFLIFRIRKGIDKRKKNNDNKKNVIQFHRIPSKL